MNPGPINPIQTGSINESIYQSNQSIRLELVFKLCFPWDSTETLDEDLVLLITNALYFGDSWTYPFEDVTDPEKSIFHLASGDKVKVNMVFRSSRQFAVTQPFTFDVLPTVTFRAVAIPYQVRALPSGVPFGV